MWELERDSPALLVPTGDSRGPEGSGSQVCPQGLCQSSVGLASLTGPQPVSPSPQVWPSGSLVCLSPGALCAGCCPVRLLPMRCGYVGKETWRGKGPVGLEEVWLPRGLCRPIVTEGPLQESRDLLTGEGGEHRYFGRLPGGDRPHLVRRASLAGVRGAMQRM